MKATFLKWFFMGVALFTFTALTGWPVFGDVIYDNSANPLWDSVKDRPDFVTGPEMGDEIALSGTARIVTQFDFALYVTRPATGVINFYSNDGPGGVPGTLLFGSGEIAIADGWNSLTMLSVTVPDTFTWTFDDLSDPIYGTFVGLRVYDPPTVGTSGDFFWYRSFPASPWKQENFPDLPDNFGARIVANNGLSAVPEPATMLLYGLGFASAGVYRRLRKKK